MYTLNLRIKKAAIPEKTTGSGFNSLEKIWFYSKLTLARKEDLKIYETKLTSYDIYNADEVFVTGSGAGIIAVTEVDKREVSDGKMGPVTR